MLLKQIGPISLVLSAEPEQYLDLSWDESGAVQAEIQAGRLMAFCVIVSCVHTCPCCGQETLLSTCYLGTCLHKDLTDFASGASPLRHRADYARDMMRDALRMAKASAKAA